MKVDALTFVHLCLPFKGQFQHAKKARSTSDTLLVSIETAEGVTGWGEILARPYVTGESHETILSTTAESLADCIVGQKFVDQDALECWVEDTLENSATRLALFGGIELALWHAMSIEQGLDLDMLIGPTRSGSTGHCLTIGFDAADDELRARAIHAGLQRATAVKLKVGLGHDRDVQRMTQLGDNLPHQIALRIDGNGSFDLMSALALLEDCRHLAIESFEEPIARNESDTHESLHELHRCSGVPLLADESVCTLDDAHQAVRTGAYQQFNIRLGKHGGLLASRRIRDLAEKHNIGLVGGSMVGESGVLTQAGRVFLARSESIPYIEGLGQNCSWLAVDPVFLKNPDAREFQPLEFRHRECQPLVKAKRRFE